MKRVSSSAFGVQSALALCLLGCGGASERVPLASASSERLREDALGNSPFTEVWVNRAAAKISSQCENASYEQCNAIDDDCNGVIDEECGYESGDVQVTVSWNSGADIDLYVTDPSGATLYYNEQHKRSSIGGHLDHDARGDCRREQQNSRIENAYWPSPSRAGAYKVALAYFSPCAQATTTEVTLSVVVDRELLGAYKFRLEPEQRIEALSFTKR